MGVLNKVVRYFDQHLILFSLLILAVAVRTFFITLPPFKIDMDSWIAWSFRLHELSFQNFYSPTYFSDYLPGYLYILYLLAFIPILFNLSNDVYGIVLKILPSFTEILLGFLIYIILKGHSLKNRLLAAGFIWFNPGLLFNSTVWGQADSILTFGLLVSTYLLTQKRYIFASTVSALSFLIKPQAILIAPIFLLNLLLNLSLKRFLLITIPPLYTLTLLSWPFFTNPIFGLFEKMMSTANGYTYTSLFAYNLWGAIGMWQQDNQYFLFFSYQIWGILLFFIAWLLVSFMYFKKRFSYYILLSFAALFFYFLPTRVHERYLYPAIPLLFLCAFLFKSKILVLLTSFLSILYFFNQYYVYVYYNELYLRLPQTLMFEPVYNFLDKNAKLMSFTSTLVFIMIVWVIIKIIYGQKVEKS